MAGLGDLTRAGVVHSRESWGAGYIAKPYKGSVGDHRKASKWWGGP